VSHKRPIYPCLPVKRRRPLDPVPDQEDVVGFKTRCGLDVASREELLLQRFQDLVVNRGRTHDFFCLALVEPVVAAQVCRLALDVDELLRDCVEVLVELGGESLEAFCQLSIISLLSQFFCPERCEVQVGTAVVDFLDLAGRGDRKSTRLNSSHVSISYAVFCLKKKK